MIRCAVASLLFAGCIPEVPSPLGEPCDGTHPCPAQTFCQANACVAALDAGATNLLSNPGFEDTRGVVFGWAAFGYGVSVLNGETVFIRSGANAARVDVDAGGNGVGDIFGVENTGPGLVSAPETGFYCGTAWVLSGSVAPPAISPESMRLALVKSTTDGGHFATTPDSGTAPPADGGWLPISNVFLATAGDLLGIRALGQSAGATSAFFIDDASLWFSPDGGCTDGP